MFNDPFHPEEAINQQHDSTRRKLLAVVCAVAVTAVLLVGYGYIRKYHAQKILANATPPPSEATPKGPALAHVTVDEPTLEKGMTIVSGVVKNVSNQQLTGVSVTLEFRRRKDGKPEQQVLPVSPGQLQPQEEGAYAAKFPVNDFASVRLHNHHWSSTVRLKERGVRLNACSHRWSSSNAPASPESFSTRPTIRAASLKLIYEVRERLPNRFEVLV
jgi:hypothetical protein